LLLSQLLTLYTTPVLYLYLDRVRLWALRGFHRMLPGIAGTTPTPGAAE
jgi:multidrug efflux pump